MTDLDLNPQAAQMADESMVRTLEAQTLAIWPQEVVLFDRYGLSGAPRILDAGCGTGQATSRLAERFPASHVLGVDIVDAHLALARARCARFGDRVRFAHQDLFHLDEAGGTFDLTVCRHVIHALPEAGRVLAELARVTRRGGWLHLIAEDYGMLHFQAGARDPREFWCEAPAKYGRDTHTDLFIGRDAFEMLTTLGLDDLRVDYVVVDTLRVPREVFANIIEAWRDGYVDPIAAHTRFTREDAAAYFNQMIADIRNPRRYAVWMVPVVSARVP